MTGGGFGGCTVTLVEKNAISQLKSVLETEYFHATGIQCVCYEAVPSEGAGELVIPKTSS